MSSSSYRQIFEEDVAAHATLYAYSFYTHGIWVFKNVCIVKPRYAEGYSGIAITKDDYCLPVDIREGEVSKDYKVWFRVRDDDQAIKILKKHVANRLGNKIEELENAIMEYQNNIDKLRPITLCKEQV